MTLAAMTRGVRRLTAGDWRVLAESTVAALVIESALHLVPLARILAAIERTAGPGASRLDRVALARTARLARWPFRVLPLPGTCLRIALVQVAVLQRRGVAATVRFGVRQASEGELEFHAWAECAGALDEPWSAGEYRTFEPVAVGALSRSVRWSPPAAPTDSVA